MYPKVLGVYRYIHLSKRWDLVIEGKCGVDHFADRPSLHVDVCVDARGFGVEVDVDTGRTGWWGMIDVGLSRREE